MKKETEEIDLESGMPTASPQRKGRLVKLTVAVTLLFVCMAAATLRLSAKNNPSIYFSGRDGFFPKALYRTRETKDYSSIGRLVGPPLNLMHNMTDSELLSRASVEAKREGYPSERVQKVAFLFLTRGSLPFQPLWERFFRGHEGEYSVYLHTAPGYKFLADNESAFYERQIPSQEVQWGSISLLDAERRLLANALLDSSNEHFILLSESCIPLYNFPTIHDYITRSLHSFLDSFDKDSRDARRRYPPQLAPDVTIQQWRKGSAWFELSRKVALSIVAETQYYNLFQKYCNFAPCFPDEHYMPTYVSMFHGDMIANRTLTWTDWSRGGPHPTSYGRENITGRFIQSIKKASIPACNLQKSPMCFLFARKFAPSALEPLLNLSSTVLGF